MFQATITRNEGMSLTVHPYSGTRRSQQFRLEVVGVSDHQETTKFRVSSDTSAQRKHPIQSRKHPIQSRKHPRSELRPESLGPRRFNRAIPIKATRNQRRNRQAVINMYEIKPGTDQGRLRGDSCRSQLGYIVVFLLFHMKRLVILARIRTGSYLHDAE